MKKSLYALTILVAAMLLQSSCSKKNLQTIWTVSSPNGKLKWVLQSHSGKLQYAIAANDTWVIPSSALGVVRSDGQFFDSLSFVSASAITLKKEPFDMLKGKSRHIENIYNTQTIIFKNDQDQNIQIECRLFNDGIAFRYRFDEKSTDTVIMLEDKTTIHIPQHAKAWMQPYDAPTHWTPAYENFFDEVKLGDTSSTGCGWSYPALFKVNPYWVLLSEAGIDADYAGIHLKNNYGSSIFHMSFPEAGEAQNNFESKPRNTLPWSITWKTFVIGSLSDIVASTMIQKLAPENRVANTGWIQPGRASWSWLTAHNSPKKYAELIPYIDLTQEMNWEYSLIDVNWDEMKGGTIEDVIAYAKEKNVGLFMWYNSGGPNNAVTEKPRDIIFNPELRRAEFKKLQEWGVKGVKIDFFQTDKQRIMQLYRDILEDAATYNLLVNFHGCTLPRGWSRTYPHALTYEAVRGAECYSFDENYPAKAPRHNTLLPFTRNVVGSMDYTPVLFTKTEYPHLTSYAHELALAVVFESGLLHFADAVEGYHNLPKEAKAYLRKVPVTWDETKLIEGQPGSHVIIARRSGKDWYVGGINGNDSALTVVVDLSFMGKRNMQMLADAFKPEQLSISNIKTGNIEINMQPRGGFVLY